MKINLINEHSVQNNNPNFSAKLQLSGNTKLITSEAVKALKEVANNIGSDADIIDVVLPKLNKFRKNKANINIAGYINGALKQFGYRIDKTEVLAGIILGLENVKESFPSSNNVIDMEDPKTQYFLKKLRKLIGMPWNAPDYSKDFLKLGKHINEPVIENGYAPIFIAIYNKEKEILELLLKHPDINVNLQDNYGNTPLHYAFFRGQVECVKLLLARKDVDKTIKNNTGKTPEQEAFGDTWAFYREYKKNGYKKFW